MYTLILVDYNSLDATICYIERCRKALPSKATDHIVIVENGNIEAALDRLSQEFGAVQTLQLDGISQEVFSFQREGQQIVYCHSGGNVGYAKGNNLGAEIAQKLWADPYYIISNNDLEFPEVFDLEIARALFEKDSEIGVIGPQVTTPEGVCQSPHRWISAFRRLIVFIWLCAFGNLLSAQRYAQIKARYCEDLCPEAPTGPCGWVSGCFMLVRAQAFHQAGMFDPYTFLYAEEPILSRRMEKAGYSVWFCRELAVIHRHAQTTKNALSRLRVLELDFQAMHYYYKTYTKTSKAVLVLAKWNFALYKCIHPLWNTLKKLRSGKNS